METQAQAESSIWRCSGGIVTGFPSVFRRTIDGFGKGVHATSFAMAGVDAAQHGALDLDASALFV